MILKTNIFYYFLLFLLLGSMANISFSQEDGKSRSLSDKPTSLAKYVVDETGTLSQSEINSLLKKLENFDKETSTQVVVYMVQSLNGESLEDVSQTIAEKNKIGRKGKNNGVLLFIAKGDKKLRIEVGYGLEGVLTDALTSQIIRKDITPSFKSGNFYEGINKGVDAIILASKGEYTSDKKKNNDNGFGLTCLGLPIFIIIIFGIIFFSIVMSIIRRIFGFSGRNYTGGNRWGGGGFFGGGSSWGGSSGGFGGFSGGGGSFGGGGSSGSW